MGSRPLRHFYDEDVRLAVDDSLGSVIEPWTRHRERFLDELGALNEAQWQADSRCAGWTNRDVICHLLDVDAFWVLSLESGRTGTPTAYLETFDPKATPLTLVDAKAGLSTADVYEQFADNTTSFRETVDSFTDAEWNTRSESPLGHVSSRLTLAHALWDSWLHERDVLVPLDLEPEVETDELGPVVWYSLFFGAAQGGLIGDPQPVGNGATDPIDDQLTFGDVPEVALRVVIDTDVYIGPATDPIDAGSALQFVEGFTGRTEEFPPDRVALPNDLMAHMTRADAIL